MRRRRRSRVAPATVNATALTDVALVLLIIFILVAPIMQAGLEVDLPSSKAPPTPKPAPALAVTLDENGIAYVGEDTLPVVDLGSALRAHPAADSTGNVAVRADRTLDYGRVIEVLGEIQAAGFSQVHLVSEAEPDR